jgi:hypothetical protein
MAELIISPDFKIDDIHRIREWNAERTKGMTVSQLNDYYAKGGEPFMRVVRAKQEKFHAAQIGTQNEY